MRIKRMKIQTVFMVGILVILGGYIVLNTYSEPVHYQNEPRTATTTVEVIPDWAEDPQAVEAAKAVVRKKQLEAELETVETNFASLTEEYNKDKEEYLKDKERLEKEIGSYWRDQSNIRSLIRKTFPQEPNVAIAVATGESGGRNGLKVNAYNPEWHYDSQGNKLCQGSYGLMQIACVHHMEDPQALYDPEFNLQVAKRVHEDALANRGDGWLPWGAYTNQKYKQYLVYR